jgi:hypothetical protein
MHASLAELLEGLKSGLLWVTREGSVRYANGLGSACTGLSAGRKLWDPDLVRAVAQTVGTATPSSVECVGVSQGTGPAPTLSCRVIPGLSRDDAFVMIQTDGSEDSAVIDKLMQVIDLDLRAPLKAASAHLAELSGRQGVPGLGDLLHDVKGLVEATETLVELSRVWRSGALTANDRIELWPLLQQVWQSVEPLATDRRIKVRFRAQVDAESLATLYGSEPWLRRVMQECLEASIRSSRPNGSLTIEHRQLGPRALIVFRDCGAFAAPVADDVPLGATGGRTASARPAARMDARDQIGLELCRHIVALHGGQLREEHEDGLRNFLIDLPTGAPFRADQAAIDVAQVQQYARDLAELMARGRRRKPAEAAQQADPAAPSLSQT